jgi:hypothetical protein
VPTAQIKELQRRLGELGPSVIVDGDFGPVTLESTLDLLDELQSLRDKYNRDQLSLPQLIPIMSKITILSKAVLEFLINHLLIILVRLRPRSSFSIIPGIILQVGPLAGYAVLKAEYRLI